MRTFFTKFNGLVLVSFSLALVLMTFGAAQAKESATTKTYVVVGTAAMHGGNVTAAREKSHFRRFGNGRGVNDQRTTGSRVSGG